MMFPLSCQNDYEIDVTVKNGEVTLKGNVETWREKVLAEKNAYQAGATSVDNQLTVEYLP